MTDNLQQNPHLSPDDLIDLSPDMVDEANLLNEFKNLKSDLLVLKKDKANKSDLKEIESKFDNKISAINLMINEQQKKNANLITQKMVKIEEENFSIIRAIKDEIRNVRADNDELQEENDKLKEFMVSIMEKVEENQEQFKELKEQLSGNEYKINELGMKMTGIESDEKNFEIDELKKATDEKLKEGMAKIEELREEFARKLSQMEKQIQELSILTKPSDSNDWINYDYKAYKLNATDFGTGISISEDGLISKESGSNNDRNSVCANLAISAFNSRMKKPSIRFYYEVEIHRNYERLNSSIGIGFCSKQFQLRKVYLGMEINSFSFGVWDKGGISIEGSRFEFEINIDNYYDEVYFNEGDIVGLGLIDQVNSKMECFATYNGKFLAKSELPEKFVDLELFPALGFEELYRGSFRTKFSKEEWSFNEFEKAINWK